MMERRRHQRVSFAHPPSARFGQFGVKGNGHLENISLGGFLLNTDAPLKIGEPIGCEFTLVNEHIIDIPALVANKVGNYYGTRFEAGSVSRWLVQEAIDSLLFNGKASILSINDLDGRRVMRICGGLNETLQEKFMSGLTNSGVEDLDLSAVTFIDEAGHTLCKIATDQYNVKIIFQSQNLRNA